MYEWVVLCFVIYCIWLEWVVRKIIFVFECLLLRFKVVDDILVVVFLCERYGYSLLRKLNIIVFVKDEFWYYLCIILLMF